MSEMKAWGLLFVAGEESRGCWKKKTGVASIIDRGPSGIVVTPMT
jgi:hypothetical protein